MKKLLVSLLLVLIPILANAQTIGSQVLSLPLSVLQGGTGATASTGTGSTVLSTSPTIVNPVVNGNATFSADVIWVGSAWSTYTPTFSTISGSGTVFGAFTARYKQLGKTVAFNLNLNITTAGTGTFAQFTLPTTTAASFSTFTCFNASTAVQYVGYASGNSNIVTLRKYDSSGVLANSDFIFCNGTYETS